MNNKPRHFLLTGPPGCGKTTLVKQIYGCLKEQKFDCFGFYTEELRVEGRRQGFDVVTLGGERSNLARIVGSGSPARSNMVGRYAVDVPSFEKAVLPILRKQNTGICIIDEIGKMELLSRAFGDVVNKIFSENNIVLATVPEKPMPFITRLKSQYQMSVIIVVDQYNRDNLVSEISNMIIETLNSTS